MRKLAILTAAAVGSAGFLLASMPAGAGDTDEFCEALVGVGEASAPDASGAFDPEVAESIADGMRDAAKRAPKKVKKAMRRLARVYENIEGDDAAEDLAAEFASDRFIRDSITYSTYYLETCANLTVPTPQP